MRKAYLCWLVVATILVRTTNYFLRGRHESSCRFLLRRSDPRYEDFPDPVAAGGDEIVVAVLAAGLHPRVRSQADGSHYTSMHELPLVPGIDGVGRGPDGLLRYFILPGTALGAMAERTVVDTRRSIVLPDPAATRWRWPPP